MMEMSAGIIIKLSVKGWVIILRKIIIDNLVGNARAALITLESTLLKAFSKGFIPKDSTLYSTINFFFSTTVSLFWMYVTHYGN